MDYWRYGVEQLAAAGAGARLPPRRRAGRLPGGSAARRGLDAAVARILRRALAAGSARAAPNDRRRRRLHRASAGPGRCAAAAASTAGLRAVGGRMPRPDRRDPPALPAPSPAGETGEDAPRALDRLLPLALWPATIRRPSPRWPTRWRRGWLRGPRRLRHQPEGPRRRRPACGADRRVPRPTSSSTPPPSPAGAATAARVLDAADVPGAAGDRSRAPPRGLARLRPRPLGRGPRDERRAAGDRRPHRHARHLLQGRARRGETPSNSPASSTGRTIAASPHVADLAAAWVALRRTPRSSGASPACCPTIPRRAGAPATPWGSTAGERCRDRRRPWPGRLSTSVDLPGPAS